MSAIVLYLTMALMVWMSSAVPNRPTSCGIRNVGGLGFNDSQCGFGEFPWTVALLYVRNRSYFGAGSLIHPRVVLTAAHKVQDKKLDDYVVRAGEWNLQTTEEYLPYEERIPSYMTYHPNFAAASVSNNFALILLKEDFPMKAHIGTVCLPPANFVQGSGPTCFSGGWGKYSFGQAGTHSVILKKVALSIVPFDSCQQELRIALQRDNFALHQSYVCAGGVGNVNKCQCDGGAPLVCPTGQNRYHQTGIVTWGIGCKEEVPALFANVSFARRWIDIQMEAFGFNTTTYTA